MTILLGRHFKYEFAAGHKVGMFDCLVEGFPVESDGLHVLVLGRKIVGDDR